MPIYESGLVALVDSNVKARRLSFTTSLAEGIAGADVVVIVTECDAFCALDFKRVKERANAPVLIDLRNV